MLSQQQQHSSTVVSAHRATASAQRRMMNKYFVPENEYNTEIERERASNSNLQWMFPLALAEEMAACLKMNRKDANEKYASLCLLWPDVKMPEFKNFWGYLLLQSGWQALQAWHPLLER